MVRLFLRAASHNPYLCDNGTTVKILDKWLIFWIRGSLAQWKGFTRLYFSKKIEFTFYIDYTK